MATGQISNAAFADALQRARQLAEKISTTQESVKRPLEDSDYQSAKRITTVVYNNGVGVPVPNSSGGMDGILTENWSVPDQMVGLIIGRGGEQITNIQTETSCRVQMVQESNGMSDRPCTLTGTKSAIDNAKRRIQELINKAHGRPPPSTPGGGGGQFGGSVIPGAAAGQIVMEMMVPGPKVGLIIGKNGETLKNVQERAGVRMTIIQDTNQLTMQEKPLRIIGEPQKCEYAKELVEQLLASKDDAPPSYGRQGGGMRTGGVRNNDFGKSLGEVIVPRMAVGVIIGKGGDMIKRIQQDSGARVQFKLGEDPNGPERTALVTGSPEQIQHATQIITELVQNALAGPGGNVNSGMRAGGGRSGGGNQQQQVFYMHVPSTKTGLIIGKGGETIKQINQESGAHVELSRDPPPNDVEKIFIIKGTPQAIHHAQHLIRVKVGDIPPGTPVPPFVQGYAAPAQSQAAPTPAAYPPGYQYNANDPNAAAWAAYYAATQYAGYPQAQANAAGAPQYYPSAMQAAPNAVAGPPQGAAPPVQAPNPQAAQPTAAAPTINPQTGQPDYSAQWAEYYRSLGMHEQAALIEQQAKANQAAAGQVGHAAPATTQLQQPQQAAYSPYAVGAQAAAGAAPVQQAYSYAPQVSAAAPTYQYQQPQY